MPFTGLQNTGAPKPSVSTPAVSTGPFKGLSGDAKAPTSFSGLTGKPYVPPESMVSKAITGIKNYAQESADTVVPFGNNILHPIDTVKKVANAFIDPLKEGVKKGGEGLYETVASDSTTPQRVAGAAKAVTGTVGAFLSPITGLFTVASKVPGAKQVGDFINLPFMALGKAGEFAADKAIDYLPESLVSKESKDILRQPLEELGSLTAQIALGGKLMKRIEDFHVKGKEVTPADAENIVKEVKAEAPTPVAEVVKPFEGLKGTPEALPEVKPVENLPAPEKPVEIAPTETPTAIESPKTPIELPKVEPKVVEDLARTFDNNTEEITPEQRLTNIEQAQHVAELTKGNYEASVRMALGEEKAPIGINEANLYEGVAREADARGDYATLDKMAKLSLARGTEFGTQLQSFDLAKTYENPLTIRKDIYKAWEGKKVNGRPIREVKYREVEKVSKQLDEKISKTRPSKQTLAEFINSIKC